MTVKKSKDHEKCFEQDRVNIDKNGIVSLNLKSKAVQAELRAKMAMLKKHDKQLISDSIG